MNGPLTVLTNQDRSPYVDRDKAAPGVALALAEDIRLLAETKAKTFPGRAARLDELRSRIQGHWEWLYQWMQD